MLRELSIRKLNNVVFIEVKAKRYEDNYKELCLMIEYIIKNSDTKLESFDIEEKFEVSFSSNKLEEIIEKAREYAEDEKVMEWCFEEKNGNIRYEDYQKDRVKGKDLKESFFSFVIYFNTLMY